MPSFIFMVSTVYPEGQYVTVIDCIYDCIGVESIAKGLFCGSDGMTAAWCIYCKDGRSCKAEDIILLKGLHDSAVHFSKLAAVAFIKNENYLLVVYFMFLFPLNE